MTWFPPQATLEPHLTDVAVENEWAGISHTISEVLLPSLQMDLILTFVLKSQVVTDMTHSGLQGKVLMHLKLGMC